MISVLILGGDAIIAHSTLGRVVNVDDAAMDGILEAREQIAKAFGYDKRKGWAKYPETESMDPHGRVMKAPDLGAADATSVQVGFDGTTIEAVLVGLVSLAERTKTDTGVSGEPAQSVSHLHDVAGTFGVRRELRARLRSRGAALKAFAGATDGTGPLVLDVEVQAPQGEG